jgi:hypothetical protein
VQQRRQQRVVVMCGYAHFQGKDGDGHGHYRVAEGLHATGVGGLEPYCGAGVPSGGGVGRKGSVAMAIS